MCRLIHAAVREATGERSPKHVTELRDQMEFKRRTLFYVEHPDELKDADIAAVTAAKTPGSAMHVLVPMLVVDELDGLKRHSATKTRARLALKMLDQVFKRVSQDNTMGLLRQGGDAPNADGSLGLGPITMELLFDPPDHERLPDNDAEIVDRALAVQTLAGRPVTMATSIAGYLRNPPARSSDSSRVGPIAAPATTPTADRGDPVFRLFASPLHCGLMCAGRP